MDAREFSWPIKDDADVLRKLELAEAGERRFRRIENTQLKRAFAALRGSLTSGNNDTLPSNCVSAVQYPVQHAMEMTRTPQYRVPCLGSYCCQSGTIPFPLDSWPTIPLKLKPSQARALTDNGSQVWLVRIGACLLSGAFQHFFQSVQLILESAQLGPFQSELVLSFHLSRLSLLFFILQRSQIRLKPGKQILDLFSLTWRVLGVAHEIFVLLNVGRCPNPSGLNLGESCAGVIESLQCACDDYFLALQSIEKNLCSLRRQCGGLQIVAQLPDLRQQ